ncbi:MAG: PH domain-containing protein [Planctomycetaceae bacterium]
MSVQAIAGVSPGSEAVVMTEYPSISSGGIGQMLGSLYESIPLRVAGPKLSYLLFTLPTAPIGILLYLFSKVFGERYVLTNRSVQIWAARSDRMIGKVDLDAIETVELDQHPGQVFFRAADLRLKDASGKTLLQLKGVPDAGSFRNAVLSSASARRLTKAAAATIAARG